MTLKEYLGYRGTLARFAKVIGVSSSTIYAWLSGRNKPSIVYCVMIERLTEGQVSCEELRPDVDWEFVRKNNQVFHFFEKAAGDHEAISDHEGGDA